MTNPKRDDLFLSMLGAQRIACDAKHHALCLFLLGFGTIIRDGKEDEVLPEVETYLWRMHDLILCDEELRGMYYEAGRKDEHRIAISKIVQDLIPIAQKNNLPGVVKIFEAVYIAVATVTEGMIKKVPEKYMVNDIHIGGIEGLPGGVKQMLKGLAEARAKEKPGVDGMAKDLRKILSGSGMLLAHQGKPSPELIEKLQDLYNRAIRVTTKLSSFKDQTDTPEYAALTKEVQDIWEELNTSGIIAFNPFESLIEGAQA